MRKCTEHDSRACTERHCFAPCTAAAKLVDSESSARLVVGGDYGAPPEADETRNRRSCEWRHALISSRDFKLIAVRPLSVRCSMQRARHYNRVVFIIVHLFRFVVVIDCDATLWYVLFSFCVSIMRDGLFRYFERKGDNGYNRNPVETMMDTRDEEKKRNLVDLGELDVRDGRGARALAAGELGCGARRDVLDGAHGTVAEDAARGAADAVSLAVT